MLYVFLSEPVSSIIKVQVPSGKSATIRESKHASGVCKEHYV